MIDPKASWRFSIIAAYLFMAITTLVTYFQGQLGDNGILFMCGGLTFIALMLLFKGSYSICKPYWDKYFNRTEGCYCLDTRYWPCVKCTDRHFKNKWGKDEKSTVHVPSGGSVEAVASFKTPEENCCAGCTCDAIPREYMCD
ncbi:hypothetical protein LCGC14_2234890 [marine sediment metagenome]|uniref:Uncharacterized protein n=1 Tax=marine sediment metagenome TaxID=412755 RepID=A0A0F9G253_9ZZZZ